MSEEIKVILIYLGQVVDEEVGTVRTRVGLVASLCRLHLATHLQQGLYRQSGGVIAVRSLLQKGKCQNYPG